MHKYWISLVHCLNDSSTHVDTKDYMPYDKLHDENFIQYSLSLYPLGNLSQACSMLLVPLIHLNQNVLSKYLELVTRQNAYYISGTFIRRNGGEHKMSKMSPKP